MNVGQERGLAATAYLTRWFSPLAYRQYVSNIQAVCTSTVTGVTRSLMAEAAPPLPQGRAVGGHARRAPARGPRAVRRERVRRGRHRGDRPRRRSDARRALPPLRGQEGPVPRPLRGHRGRAGAVDRRRGDVREGPGRGAARRRGGVARRLRGPGRAADRPARRALGPRLGGVAGDRAEVRLRPRRGDAQGGDGGRPHRDPALTPAGPSRPRGHRRGGARRRPRPRRRRQDPPRDRRRGGALHRPPGERRG